MNTHTDKLIQDGLWRDISEAPRDGTQILVEGGTVEWRLPFTESTNNNGELNGWFSHSAQRFLQWKPTHFRPLPDDRLANALKVAVEALDYISFGTCDCTRCVEMCQCHEIKAQEALTEIENIAKGGELMHMMEDEKAVHDSILSFGWGEWQCKHQMGSEYYNKFMRKLNPFAKAYYRLLERYMTAERLLKEARKERDHYKERYLGIAASAHTTIKAFSDEGLKL